jgi:hypothetical protein
MQLLARRQLLPSSLLGMSNCFAAYILTEWSQLHAPVPTRDAATVAALLLRGLLETASTCTSGMHLVPGLLCIRMTG